MPGVVAFSLCSSLVESVFSVVIQPSCPLQMHTKIVRIRDANVLRQ